MIDLHTPSPYNFLVTPNPSGDKPLDSAWLRG